MYTGNRVQKNVALASAYPRILEDKRSGKQRSVWLQTEFRLFTNGVICLRLVSNGYTHK